MIGPKRGEGLSKRKTGSDIDSLHGKERGNGNDANDADGTGLVGWLACDAIGLWMSWLIAHLHTFHIATQDFHWISIQ